MSPTSPRYALALVWALLAIHAELAAPSLTVPDAPKQVPLYKQVGDVRALHFRAVSVARS